MSGERPREARGPAVSLVGLREQRRRKDALTPAWRAAVGDWLSAIAAHIAKDELVRRPTGLVVILMSEDEPPEVLWRGVNDHEQFSDAHLALSDAHDFYGPRYRGTEWPPTCQEHIDERWRRRRELRANSAASRAASLAAVPWRCEFCSRRFSTERGAKSHERRCWDNPDSTRCGVYRTRD